MNHALQHNPINQSINQVIQNKPIYRSINHALQQKLINPSTTQYNRNQPINQSNMYYNTNKLPIKFQWKKYKKRLPMQYGRGGRGEEVFFVLTMYPRYYLLDVVHDSSGHEGLVVYPLRCIPAQNEQSKNS